MMDLLRDEADGKTVVNLYPFVCSLALDVIAGGCENPRADSKRFTLRESRANTSIWRSLEADVGQIF